MSGLEGFDRSVDDCRKPRADPVRLQQQIVSATQCDQSYGALSNPGGRVEIKSILDEKAQRFKLVWEEKGGPVVKEPKRRSFGTRLIESSLARLLHGDARLRFEPSGVICEFDFPLASLQTSLKNGRI